MTEVKVFASGFRFPEGPAIGPDGSVYLVELGGGRVSAVSPSGETRVFAHVGGSPNGGAFGPDGALYVCNNGGRHPAAASTDNEPGAGDAPETIQRVAPDGTVSVVVSEIDGVGLNAPNDICFDGHGGYYFSDPTWEFSEDGMAGPGSICYVDRDGRASRVHTGLRFPNGVGLSADRRALLITESSTGDIWALSIEGAGVTGEIRRFGSCGAGALPDGFALDQTGRVLVAGHGTDQIYVFDADGNLESTVPLGAGAGPSNVCFGGAEHRTVFVTAANSGDLLAFEWPIPGDRLPS